MAGGRNELIILLSCPDTFVLSSVAVLQCCSVAVEMFIVLIVDDQVDWAGAAQIIIKKIGVDHFVQWVQEPQGPKGTRDHLSWTQSLSDSGNNTSKQ